jgi:hypothetical protein
VNFDYQAWCRITGAVTDRVYGVLKELVEAHARRIYGTPTNADSSIRDLELATQFEGLG